MSERKCVSYKVLVGLEIHVQLATKTKMFTGVANASGAMKPGETPPEPNTAVDEQIMAFPGVLPVMNKRAVEYSIMTGLALGCEIARFSKWDRKSYYYPDLPKNYQISQYDLPLCNQGSFEIASEDGTPKTIRIRRAHLEEDAGKLLHEAPGGYAIDFSIVDLNRAGTPLLEIVTEPDLTTPKEVATFGQELQKLVQFLGVSEGQMQLGHMRFEPNINVHITDQNGEVFKTAITEIKNLNSFSVLERATAYEIRRQIHQWEQTGNLGRKSTYGWDDAKEETFLQREKEEAHDYRYFPDPDLMPVEVSDAWLMELKGQVGELPAARRKRYADSLGLNATDAASLAADKSAGDFFEGIVEKGIPAKRASVLMEALREMSNERALRIVDIGIAPDHLAEVGKLIESGKIAASKEVTKKVLDALLGTGKTVAAPNTVAELAQTLGLVQTTDTAAIDAAIDAVLATNPKPLEDYKSGKQSAMGALVGMVMKSARGMNAKLVQERLKEKLG
ncbi:MAG: Asp-tRNA(Asn)/Glu-tRNA(Gln) amidotransferase subunit GatB [Burkholderiales bacterium]|nr:Asp-tRNA(Asn)/Glu-tRNA(Gln) amidotransferase subunit GatB [Phycisphaerae bacterium]